MFLVLMTLALYAILFAYHAVHQSVTAHTEIHYGEATWFFEALRVRYGRPLYFDYSHPPYIAMIYPPLAPEIAGVLAAALGTPDEAIVLITRAVSMASTIAVAGGVFALCRWLGAGTIPATIAALLVLTPTDTWQLWGHVARGDMLAIALGVWSLFFVMGAPRLPSLIASGALAGLAITAKQSEIAPILAGAWWLVAQRRNIVPYLGSALAAIALVLLPLGGDNLQLMLRNIADLSSHPWNDGAFFGRLGDIPRQFGPTTPLAALGFVPQVASPFPRGLMIRYVTVAAVVFLLTAGKIGSASQYSLEILTVLSIFAGLGVQWLFERSGPPQDMRVGALVFVTAALGVQTAQALNTARTWQDPGADDRPVMALEALQRGPVFSDDGFMLLHGPDPPILLDPYYFSVMQTLGRWDEKPLVNMVAQQQFSAVVLNRPIETPFYYQGFRWIPAGVLDQVAQKYELSQVLGRYYIYVPRLQH